MATNRSTTATRRKATPWWIEQNTDHRIEGVRRAQKVLHDRHFGIDIPFAVMEQAIWEATKTAQFGPECTGAGDCTVEPHRHGCYADTEGHCDEPNEHAANGSGGEA